MTDLIEFTIKMLVPKQRNPCIIKIPIELSGVKHDIKKQQLANWKARFCASNQFSQLNIGIVEKRIGRIILFTSTNTISEVNNNVENVQDSRGVLLTFLFKPI